MLPKIVLKEFGYPTGNAFEDIRALEDLKTVMPEYANEVDSIIQEIKEEFADI